MDDKNLKEELFKEIKIRGLLEQEEDDDTDDSTDNTEDTDEGDGKLYKLSSKTIKILTDRIKDEYAAHYFYRAATNW
jgi:ATP-dependent helicase/DNAse subunit B